MALSTNNPYYNPPSGANYVQTLMPANSVTSIWLIALPAAADADSQKYRFLWMQGQWITQAQNNTPEGREWLLVIKKNKKKPVVMLDMEHFFSLMERLNDSK